MAVFCLQTTHAVRSFHRVQSSVISGVNVLGKNCEELVKKYPDGYVEFLITHWKFCTVHLSLINHHMIQYVWSMFLMFAIVTENCLCTGGALFLDWWTRRLLVVCRSFWVLEGLTVTFPWCNSLPCLLSSLYWDSLQREDQEDLFKRCCSFSCLNESATDMNYCFANFIGR